jgi:predicted nucleotidyltransferase
VLPKLTDAEELPPGVHTADWEEFESRFGGFSPKRLWLLSRLRALLELASTGGQLRRVFVWGSFVTGKPAPRDLDILLIMSASRLRFHEGEALVRIGRLLGTRLDWRRGARCLAGHLSNLQKLSKTRYCELVLP